MHEHSNVQKISSLLKWKPVNFSKMVVILTNVFHLVVNIWIFPESQILNDTDDTRDNTEFCTNY